MKKLTFTLLMGTAAFLTSCVVTSVHPYYTAKDLVFEPALLGQWTNTQQSDERWTFEKAEPNLYNLTYVSGGKTNLSLAYAFKLEGETFLDVTAKEPQSEILPPPIPSHLLLRVFEVRPNVRLAALNNDWLRTLLEKEPKALRHELLGDKPDDRQVVLTADTDELQQFLAKHLKTEPAWKDTFDLKRNAGSTAK
jgi:hypothetical protein